MFFGLLEAPITLARRIGYGAPPTPLQLLREELDALQERFHTFLPLSEGLLYNPPGSEIKEHGLFVPSLLEFFVRPVITFGASAAGLLDAGIDEARQKAGTKKGYASILGYLEAFRINFYLAHAICDQLVKKYEPVPESQVSSDDKTSAEEEVKCLCALMEEFLTEFRKIQ